MLANEHLCQIILKSMHKCSRYGPDKLSFMTILSFDRQVWPWPSTYLNKCFKWTTAKLFWNPCINVEDMAQISPIYDQFIIWSWCMTLTVNLPEQMFQMNNCAKWFWNSCINVEVMAQISSIYNHFIIWPSNVTLTFNLPIQMFPMALLLKGEQLCQMILNSMHKCISNCYGPANLNLWPFYNLTFKYDPDLQPTWTNVSNGTSTCRGFWNPCINVEVMACTNPGGRTHVQHMHIHRTEIVTTMSWSPQAGWTKMLFLDKLKRSFTKISLNLAKSSHIT